MPELLSPAASAGSSRYPTIDVDATLNERLSPARWLVKWIPAIPQAIVLVAIWIIIRARSSRGDAWSPGC